MDLAISDSTVRIISGSKAHRRISIKRGRPVRPGEHRCPWGSAWSEPWSFSILLFDWSKRFERRVWNSVDFGGGHRHGDGCARRDHRPHRSISGQPRDHGERTGPPDPRDGVSGWGEDRFQPGAQAGHGGGNDRAEVDSGGTRQQPLPSARPRQNGAGHRAVRKRNISRTTQSIAPRWGDTALPRMTSRNCCCGSARCSCSSRCVSRRAYS